MGWPGRVVKCKVAYLQSGVLCGADTTVGREVHHQRVDGIGGQVVDLAGDSRRHVRHLLRGQRMRLEGVGFAGRLRLALAVDPLLGVMAERQVRPRPSDSPALFFDRLPDLGGRWRVG